MLFDTDSGGSKGYEIQKSLRFRASASAYLSRTPSVAGNRKTWTWSGWVKLGALAGGYLFASGTSGSNQFVFHITSGNALELVDYRSDVAQATKTTTALLRDPSAHYHVMLVVDTTQAVAEDRFKIYLNGVRLTSFSTNTVNTLQNADLDLNQAGTPHVIGPSALGGGYLDGYLSEINFIDGQALDASYFGQTDPVTGQWVPKKYTGTYGTNGFYLPFTDGTSLSTLTADKSGNGNNWTANNISLTSGATYDWMDDTPSNNFVVLNPLNLVNAPTLSNANLTSTGAGGASRISWPTMFSSSKWYAEFVGVSWTTQLLFGVVDSAITFSVSYNPDGQKSINGALSAYGASYTDNDVIGVACDSTTGTVEFFKNGISQGIAYSSLSGAQGGYIDHNGAQASIAHISIAHINFGQRPFTYTPPAGFKALCTKNLPTGTITTSGTFSGNASTDGPFVYLNGVPTAMTINGNAVTLGNHADKLSNGFKVRSSSASYNSAGSNTYSITSTGTKFKYSNAQGNP